MRAAPILTLLLAGLLAGAPAAAQNLVVNGSFDNPDDFLLGWKYKYDRAGESHYFDNHEFISVLPAFEGRRHVLAIQGKSAILKSQGAKVDSQPIPVEKGARYKLTVTAQSTGPSARILAEGYQWRPGIKPHPHPELHELRKCFRGEVLYFGNDKGGPTSTPSKRSWETASVTFPSANPSDLAQSALARMEFVVLHIVAILGAEGTLYLDDVKLEKVAGGAR